jgi:hypothetical protein
MVAHPEGGGGHGGSGGGVAWTLLVKQPQPNTLDEELDQEVQMGTQRHLVGLGAQCLLHIKCGHDGVGV